MLCCFNPWHVGLITGLAYTRITIFNWLIVKLFSYFDTSVWWRLVIGLIIVYHNSWPTIFRCAIWFLAKHSTLVILSGSCLWTSVHEDTGHCILKQNWFRHCLCRCCSYTSKRIIKPDDELGFCCLSIPYCQWQYSTVYAMRVSTEPSLREWLRVALFCSYRSRWSDVPRKIFKRSSNNLLHLVSYYLHLLHAMNLSFRLKLMLVLILCSQYVGLLCISWDCWDVALANTYWRANRKSQDPCSDIISLMHPHA